MNVWYRSRIENSNDNDQSDMHKHLTNERHGGRNKVALLITIPVLCGREERGERREDERYRERERERQREERREKREERCAIKAIT